MNKIIHAFVTTNAPQELRKFYETQEIFYQRFNPDREFNYVDLADSTSHIIMEQNPDDIMQILTDNQHPKRHQYNIKIDYDYVVLHWSGSTMRGHNGILYAYNNYLKEFANDEFLVMGHIIDGKEHSKGKSWNSGNYYFMYPITCVINLNMFKKIGYPALGQGKHRKHLWIAHRTHENIHDNYTPLKLMPGDGTEEVDTKMFGWNIIHESLKNDLPVLNLPVNLRKQKTFVYPDVKPVKFAKLADALWNMPVIDQDGQQKWFIQGLARKWGVVIDEPKQAKNLGTIFLFNTEFYVWEPEPFNYYDWSDLKIWLGPASGFKDFVLAYKKYDKFPDEVQFIHFDVVQHTLDLKKHIIEWDGDVGTFYNHVSSYRDYERIKDDIWPHRHLWRTYLDEMISQFDTYEQFLSRWKEYQKQRHKFIKANILEDSQQVTNWLGSRQHGFDKQARAMLWTSDIYLGTNELVYGLDNLKKKFNKLLADIYITNSNTLLDYKKFDDIPEFDELYNVYERELIKENKSFCVYPWIHMQYKPNGQPKPCCRFNLDAKPYNEIDKSKFWGDTVFLQKLLPLNAGKIDKTKYPGIDFEKMPKLAEGGNVSIEGAFNSDFWNDLREKMLKGESIPGCNKCYQEEAYLNEKVKTGDFGTSMRMAANVQWNKKWKDTHKEEWKQRIQMTPILPKKILYLELGFGNYCNLACRMCSSNLSTTWYDDDKALKGKFGRQLTPKIEDADVDVSDETLQGLLEIKFTGGEPMIHPNFAKLIERIVNLGVAKNISLEIFTNCSYYPSEKITKDLTQFRQVNLALSIDGYDKVNEYIRYPSNWKKVDLSARKWLLLEKENNNVMVQVNPTITIYNILYLDDFMDWWYSIKQPNMKDGAGRLGPSLNTDYTIVFNYATWPSYLNKFLLPAPILKELEKKYTAFGKKYKDKKDLQMNMRRLLARLRNPSTVDSSLQEFYEYTKELDSLRKQKLKDALPELYEIIKPLINPTT